MIKRTLYFGNPAYLSLRNAQMVIRLPEIERNKEMPDLLKKEAVKTIPIEDIGVVVLDHREITITHGLIAALLDNSSAVITCDDKRMPVGMLLPLQGNSIQNERFRQQLNASEPLKKQLWQQTVREKINNQAALLHKHTDCPIARLKKLAKEVKSGDMNNCEAHAAIFYWKNIFIGHPMFIREREGESPNNLLNYGYAILRAVVARALVVSGLLPIYGIHHHNRYNDYCLADDIMEPYRPFVDEVVIEIMRETKEIDVLTVDIKRKLLSIPVLDVRIAGKRSPLMVAVSQTTASLAKCFAGELRKIVYPELS